MQLRPLGGSGLKVAPLAFGGNVLGWTADEATSFEPARRLRRRRLQSARHRRRLLALGQGPQRRRKRDRDRPLAQEERQAQSHRAGHQGRHGHGRRQDRPGAEVHPPGGRRLAAPAADRPHRPVPGAPGRPEDTAGRNAGHFCRPDSRRQGARHRRQQLQRRASRRGVADQRQVEAAALRIAAAAVQPGRAPRLRGRARGAVSARGSGCHQLLRPGQRFSHRQVPQRSRCRTRARAAATPSRST